MNLSVQKFSAEQPIIGHLDRIAAIMMALCPVLQHYKAPVYNAALTVMVLLVPYLLLRILSRVKDFQLAELRPVWALIAYMIFRVVDHGTSVTELGQSTVLIVFFVAAALKCIDLKWMCRAALYVACAASIVLIIQYLVFYLFAFHVQVVPVSLLLPSADQWVLSAQTGLVGVTGVIRTNGFYRPSAFFLEPSHVYIYLFPHLLVVLFGKKHKRKELLIAILLSLGLVLCTSGMGIAVVCAAWAMYFALFNEKTQTFTMKNILRRHTKIVLLCAFVAFVLAFAFVPMVRKTITRIFFSATGSSAIGGRVSAALAGMKDFTPKQWILGITDTTHGTSHNMPGAIAAVYRHGLIGMILSMEFYTKSMWKLKMPFWLAAGVIFVTSLFSAHTHSTVGMMYYVLILMRGYQTRLRTEGFVETLRGMVNRTA